MSSNEPGQNPVLQLRPRPRPCAPRGADDDDCLFVHNDVETSLNGQKSRIYSYDWQKPTCTSHLLLPLPMPLCQPSAGILAILYSQKTALWVSIVDMIITDNNYIINICKILGEEFFMDW